MNAVETDIMRSILYAQVKQLPPQEREKAAVLAVQKTADVLKRYGIPGLPELKKTEQNKLSLHLEELRRDGITLLGPLLSPRQIKDIHSYLTDKPAYGSHVWTFSDHIGKPLSVLKQDKAQACYKLSESLVAPHIPETISSPFIIKLIEQYLGCLPTLFQTNLLWSFHNPANPPAVAQGFHRDWDNFRFCVLFIYLTDVNKRNGAHQYLKGTHRYDYVEKALERYRQNPDADANAKAELFYQEQYGFGDQFCLPVFGHGMAQVEAPAGFAFLANGFGLHRGLPLLEGERLMLWARFGLYDNGFSVDVSPEPLPAGHLTGRIPDSQSYRYIFRSVIQTEFSQPPGVSLHPAPASGNPAPVHSDINTTQPKGILNKLYHKLVSS